MTCVPAGVELIKVELVVTKITKRKIDIANPQTHLLVVGCSQREWKARTKSSNSAFGRLVSSLGKTLIAQLERCDFNAKDEQVHRITRLGERTHTILIVATNVDDAHSFEGAELLRKMGASIHSAARECKAASIAITGVRFLDQQAVSNFLQGVNLANYRFLEFKSEPEKNKHLIEEIIFDAEVRFSADTVSRTHTIVEATCFARDLVNRPPNECPPKFLVKTAQSIKGIRTKIYDRRDLEKLGANALLAVARGSEQSAYLIDMHYRPNGKVRKRVALVGKGITFDSGGLSIKPAASMETMKCDMAGAAVVLAVMRALPALRPALEVRAYVPTAENMINGEATRPGDIVKALSGKTIEILNTDAEGRLILADALCFAQRWKPDAIIDLATLTGACMVALGTDYAGLFSSDEKLSKALMSASESAGERLWRLPLAPEYRELIKSKTADIKNTGGRFGGAITAALFLQEFVEKKFPWAHLDIAGPAFNEGSPKPLTPFGASGFGVRTILRYLTD